jgi:carbamoyl-phosphate synthase large subunit
LEEAGLSAQLVYRLSEGRPHVLDLIKNGEIHFIINTPHGKAPRQDEVSIRSAAVASRIPIMTTLRAARMSARAIKATKLDGYGVKSLQEYQS